MLFSIVGSIIYHPTATDSIDNHEITIYGGICQWSFVFAMIAMFASYYYELNVIYNNKNSE